MYKHDLQENEEKIFLSIIREGIDLSQFLSENGTIDMVAVLSKVTEMNNQKLLTEHPYAITQLSNGRWQTFLPDSRSRDKRKQVRRVQKEDLEKYLIEYYKKKKQVITIEKVAYEWLHHKEQEPNFKKSSYDRYENNYKRIFLSIKDCDIKNLTEVKLEDYLHDEIISKKVTRRAWVDIKIVIRGIFKYAKRHDYTDIVINDVLEYLDDEKKIFAKKKSRNDSDDVFTDEEIASIEEYIDGRNSVSVVDIGIKLAIRTGLRAGELAGLKYSEYSADERYIWIMRTERHSKDQTGHIVYYFSDDKELKADHPAEKLYLTERAMELIEYLHEVHPDNDYLFFTDHYIRSHAFTKRLNCICKIIGIKPRSLHKLRKTYATRLINAGVDKALVKSQLRHNDITTTLKYYYRNNTSDKMKADLIEKALGQY
ncbi:MAG: tyrosine-type recombinase/integrase [Lachnospiraceae bacterium]|nr:tyrosine-type recombinase/integrase [Lachnospiraceae bacterium]